METFFLNIYSDKLSVWPRRPVVSVFPVTATRGAQLLYECSQTGQQRDGDSFVYASVC